MIAIDSDDSDDVGGMTRACVSDATRRLLDGDIIYISISAEELKKIKKFDVSGARRQTLDAVRPPCLRPRGFASASRLRHGFSADCS